MNITVVFEADSPDFGKLAKIEQHPQKRVRLLALEQLKLGKRIGKVAELFGVERHVIGEWYARYKQFGLKGLDNLPRSGRKPKLSREREEEFIQKTEALQNSKNGGRITGYDIQKMARQDFGADYSDSYIYTVLKRLNVSWITARSIHPKANEAEQTAFKKTLNKKLSKSSQII